jgi:hypothetical protein
MLAAQDTPLRAVCKTSSSSLCWQGLKYYRAAALRLQAGAAADGC